MQRYFVDKENVDIKRKIIYIIEDYHHIKNVMRMKLNDKIYVCDNDNNVYLCVISSFNDDNVECEIIETILKKVELEVDVTIAQGLVRREKTEEVLRRITELGASGYMSVIMDRSIVKIKDSKNSKIDRYKTIVKEASEQSHRSKLMKVYETLNIRDFINFSKNYDLCLFAYEESGRKSNYDLKRYLCNFDKKSILVLVGPEGGFSENEVKVLLENNFKAIGLGPRILRTETAPLYIMSAISYEMELEVNES